MTYDGSFTSSDTTITFDNAKIFYGWTANDGSAGEYTYDFGAWSGTNSAEASDMTYVVNWSTDDNGTLTAHTTIESDGETMESIVVINDDESGSYSYTYTDADGNVQEDISIEWDANGEIVSGG